MKFSVVSEIGNIRKNNEDSYYVPENEKFPLFIVADGIGGHKSGEIASYLAVKIIKENIKCIDEYNDIEELEDDFVKAISLANMEIYEKSKNDFDLDGMGTTLTILYFYKDAILIGHVGDSRTYAIGENSIQQLTEDDTFVNKLIKLGEISKTEAMNHPQKNIITNAVGTDARINISLIQYNFSEGEYILVCTDGLTDMVTNEEIMEIVNKYKDTDVIKNELLEKALKAGGKDNVTFIIIQI